MNVYAINGRFGAYVQLGETPEKGIRRRKPKRSSLTGGMTESTVTLDEALKLLALPRELGAHPETGEPIVAGLGRFGPYVKHGDDYRSLEVGRRSVHGRSRRGARAASRAEALAPPAGAPSACIRKIEVPDGGTALQVLEGRYGPYVTDGETNASIPKGTNPATLSLGSGRGAARGAPRRGRPSRRGRRGAAGAAQAAARRRAPRPTRSQQTATATPRRRPSAQADSRKAAAGKRRRASVAS